MSQPTRGHNMHATGTPSSNASIPHHLHHQRSDSAVVPPASASAASAAAALASLQLNEASASPPLHGHAPSSNHYAPQPMMSAPTRGAGLWAPSSALATPPASSLVPAAAIAAAAAATANNIGGPPHLTRPASLAPEHMAHHSSSASMMSHHDLGAAGVGNGGGPVTRASSNSWSVAPPVHTLPPRTKIICTIGPASQSSERMRAMLHAGMNVVRLNFSHGDHEYHKTSIANLRDVTAETRRICAILLDTKGPEIRTGKLAARFEATSGAGSGAGGGGTGGGGGFSGVGGVPLQKGQDITLVTDESVLCDATRISVGYSALPKLLRAGHHVLIDDGLLDLLVLESIPATGEVKCRVLNSGVLGACKSVNLPGVAIDLPAVTQKDVSDIRLGIEQGVDFIAASFVRRASDVLTVRKILGQRGASIKIISKIENQEGLDNFEAILAVSDGIMVARGDLGVEIPLEQVALAQKRIIRACNAAGKFVITATQMLESMSTNPSPTRAEASDVANAVLDGTDCVMLSGETAAGRYPVETVQMMADICREAEASMVSVGRSVWVGPSAADAAAGSDSDGTAAPGAMAVSVTEAIASSSVRATFDLRAAVIIVLTETGTTARLVSKYRPHIPIITVTSSEQTARQSLVSRGLFPLLVGSMVGSDSLIPRVLLAASRLGMCKAGDLAVVTSGSREATAGATNDMKVVCVAT